MLLLYVLPRPTQAHAASCWWLCLKRLRSLCARSCSWWRYITRGKPLGIVAQPCCWLELSFLMIFQVPNKPQALTTIELQTVSLSTMMDRSIIGFCNEKDCGVDEHGWIGYGQFWIPQPKSLCSGSFTCLPGMMPKYFIALRESGLNMWVPLN